MKYKIKLIIATLISLMPLNFIRVFLYKYLLNYKIKNSKIGFLTIINVKKASINNSKIGNLNIFNGAFNLELQDKNTIGNSNHFHCGLWVEKREEFKASLILKKESSISHKHYFDIAGKIIIDNSSRVAGIASQFWTHGSLKKDINIYIGKNCYIGSGVKFAPGTFVADDSLVAMGSVVGGEFKEKNTLIGGVPAKVIKTNINWKENWV